LTTCLCPELEEFSPRPCYILNIHLNIILQCTPASSSDFLPAGFQTKILYASLFFSIRCTFSLHFVVLHLIARIMFGEKCNYESPSAVYCTLFTTPPFLGSNFFSSIRFSITSVCILPLIWKAKFHIHTKRQAELSFRIFQSSCF